MPSRHSRVQHALRSPVSKSRLFRVAWLGGLTRGDVFEVTERAEPLELVLGEGRRLGRLDRPARLVVSEQRVQSLLDRGALGRGALARVLRKVE